MSELMWIKSHVELLLQDVWQVCRVQQDPDGDYPFRCGTAACWVSVLDVEPAMVRVFAHAAFGVRSSAKLLRELNSIQRNSVSVRVEHDHGVVLVSQAVHPVGLSAPVLRQALDAVGSVAGEIGGLVAAMFDGHTPFEPVPEPADEDEDAA